MGDVRYLYAGEVIALHDFIMQHTGSPPAALRDVGLLEAALMRPQMAAHYEQADLFSQAVVLAVGISQAQAFVNGNQRAAFAALDVFLRLNGWRFGGDSLELAQRLESIAVDKNKCDEAIAEFDRWLREHVERLDP